MNGTVMDPTGNPWNFWINLQTSYGTVVMVSGNKFWMQCSSWRRLEKIKFPKLQKRKKNEKDRYTVILLCTYLQDCEMCRFFLPGLSTSHMLTWEEAPQRWLWWYIFVKIRWSVCHFKKYIFSAIKNVFKKAYS